MLQSTTGTLYPRGRTVGSGQYSNRFSQGLPVCKHNCGGWCEGSVDFETWPDRAAASCGDPKGRPWADVEGKDRLGHSDGESQLDGQQRWCSIWCSGHQRKPSSPVYQRDPAEYLGACGTVFQSSEEPS